MTKLTDTQLVILSGASQRQDGLVEIPSRLTGAARNRVINSLLKQGFLKEMQARHDAPVWRRDETEGSFALKITRAGITAIGVTEEASEPDGTGADRPAPKAAPGKAQPAPDCPKAGSKIDRVVVLLQRKNGASLDELVTITGWLPHTTRAAITGLRKRGYAVDTFRRKNKKTSYRITNAVRRHVQYSMKLGSSKT